jgi:hypothetical protein
MSAEHKALGYRPPPGSLAAEAQAAAAKHPDAHVDVPATALREAARVDAARIAATRGDAFDASDVPGGDLARVGEADAAALESAEHKALGYRPPKGSLAADAQALAATQPESSSGFSPAQLAAAGRQDAELVRAEHGDVPLSAGVGDAALGQAAAAPVDASGVDVATVSAGDARVLQSEGARELGYRPPAGTLAAEAQSAVDARANEPMSKDAAADV